MEDDSSIQTAHNSYQNRFKQNLLWDIKELLEYLKSRRYLILEVLKTCYVHFLLKNS